MGKATALFTTALAIALVGTTYWGYKEHQEKKAILIKVENQYQQEFHNVAFYMDQLESELGKSLAVNSRKQLGPSLTKIWRLAYSAQNSIGQLPLALMPFNKTEAFLSRIGDFTYKTAVRDLDDDPLSEKEWKTLQGLFNSAKEINGDIVKVQDKMVNNRLQWMDVETVLAAGGKKNEDNSIIDGFKLIDKRVAGYEDLETSMDTQNSEEVRIEKLKKLSGQKINEEDAKNIAIAFVGNPTNAQVSVHPNSDKAIYSAYDVLVKSDTESWMVEVTQKGGQVLWMINSREIEKGSLSLENAQVKAARFIKNRDINNMEVVKIEQFDDEAIFTFVRHEGGVRVYPDSIIIKVALDRGDVIGYYAEGHVVNKTLDSTTTAHIDLNTAKKGISPNFTVDEQTLAIIVNDLNEEVLCYEFSGRVHDTYYRVYINAKTGEEEKVEKLKYTKDNL